MDGFKHFVEGEALVSLRQEIEKNTEILKGLE